MSEKPHIVKPGDAITISDEVEVKNVVVINVGGKVHIYINGHIKIVQGYEQGEDNKGSAG